jgi:hypothetical protein
MRLPGAVISPHLLTFIFTQEKNDYIDLAIINLGCATFTR